MNVPTVKNRKKGLRENKGVMRGEVEKDCYSES